LAFVKDGEEKKKKKRRASETPKLAFVEDE